MTNLNMMKAKNLQCYVLHVCPLRPTNMNDEIEIHFQHNIYFCCLKSRLVGYSSQYVLCNFLNFLLTKNSFCDDAAEEGFHKFVVE